MHPDFQAGRYRAVADDLLEAKAARRKRYFASLVGALSFLGRLEEAEDFLAVVKPGRRSVDAAAARFYLAMGRTRLSDYDRAKSYLAENEAYAPEDPLARFFVRQGHVFFFFYTGDLNRCREAGEAARRAAIAARNPFARALATDSLGHVKVRLGNLNEGLALLQEAEELASRVGNATMRAAVEISRELYACEFGLRDDPCGVLTKLSAQAAPENNYSRANVALELSRQLTLRGRYAEGTTVLESIAPVIYASRNRRHEIWLNLRLAELAGRQGAYFRARHYLWFSRRLLHQEVDASLELAALGIERKLALAEGKFDAATELRAQARALGDRFPSARDQNLRFRERDPAATENPEDRIHLVLKSSAAAPNAQGRLRPLLEAGYLAEASLALKLDPASPTLAILPGKLGLLTQDQTGIAKLPGTLTSLQYRLLRLLREGEQGKAALVEGAWGYRYAPLRHDGMLYAAISGLRRVLGPAAGWLQATEGGYRFAAALHFGERAALPASPAPAPAPAPLSSLNHRQVQIMEWLGETRFLNVKDCRDRFGSSEITALRDLAGLCRMGHVVKIGKARATRYTLRSEER